MQIRYLLCALVLWGCTDADRAGLWSYGEAGDVTCYSGGRAVYTGRSTGKIQSTQQSDGWEFKDAATGKFVRVSGDCVVTN